VERVRSASRGHRVQTKKDDEKMVRRAIVFLLGAAVAAQVCVSASDVIARFDGGIGVIPVANGAGPVNADGTFPNAKLNIVRGVLPGAGPWRIGELKADVDVNGRIKVRGRGLLLASGNGIGSNANQSVFATLICEAAAPFVQHNTDPTGVALDANGDFRIDDFLDPLPSTCPSPVLLIRNTGGVWFAAAIPAFGND